MRLGSLRLWQFRCFEDSRFDPQPGLNVLLGENGCGKTSVLEALQLLSTGRSFRTGDRRDLQRNGAEGGFAIQAALWPPSGALAEHWDLRSAEALSLSIDGSSERFVRAAARFPYRVVAPGMEGLLDASAVRRSLLDWVLFHVEPAFLDVWQRYQRALRQRQELLRAGAPVDHAEPWHQILADTGASLTAWRQAVMESLIDGVDTDGLLKEWGVELAFEPGWEASTVDSAFWEAAWKADLAVGYARSGAHRADIAIRAAGRRAQRRLSRGQVKAVMVVLLLAAAEVLQRRGRSWPILAIDDWRSELGPALADALWMRFIRYPGQLFLTELGVPGTKVPEAAWFHVEQGRVRSC